jgi:hypothetical protein
MQESLLYSQINNAVAVEICLEKEFYVPQQAGRFFLAIAFFFFPF